MAKTATQIAAAAAKADKAKAAAAKAAAPVPAPKAAKAPAGEATATIKITKGEGQQGTVDVGVNGRIQHLKVDSEVAVNKATLEALSNSSIEFSTISPLAGEGAAEGSAASSTVTGTAIRGEEATKADNPAQPAHELSQVPDADIVKQQQGAGSDQKPLDGPPA